MFDTLLLFFTSFYSSFFLITALFGGVLFFLRILLLMITALHTHLPHDSLHEYDFDHGEADFKLLTLHSFSGFCMIGGLAGLACIENYYFSVGAALFAALLSGLCMMVITAYSMKLVVRLRDTGSVFTLKQTVGLRGIVYQEIPAQGSGKIQIIVTHATREILAQSKTGKPIPSFTHVRVTAVLDAESVQVEKVD